MGFIKLRFEKDKEEKPIKTLRLGKKGKEFKERKEIKKPQIGKAVKKGFVLDWENELGYSTNPFKVEILKPVSKYIAGYKKKKSRINLFIINNEKFGIISGEDGVGKTTLLQWLYEQLQKYKDKVMVCYLTGKVLSQEFVLLKSIVNPLLNVYEKKVKKLNKDVDIERNLSVLKRKLGNKKLVLLIDDAVVAPDRVVLLLKKMYSAMPLQIIIACTNQVTQKLRIENWLDDRLKMHLKGLDVPEATTMISKRIEAVGGEDIYPFDDDYLKRICKESSHNPKQILYLCQHYAMELAVKHIERKKKEQKEDTVVKEEKKTGVKEEEKEEEKQSEVPVLKEIPKKTEYRIGVISHGSEAISMEDLKKDEKGNYKIKGVKKK